jgi:hypothetical protein
MLNFRKIALWVGLPGGVSCIILATLLVLRGLEGAASWTSSTETDTVVGFLLFAVGTVSLWLCTRRAPRRIPKIPVRSTADATNEEGMKRLREAFGSPWPAAPREEPPRRAAGR